MKTHPCCQLPTRGRKDAPRPASGWRRSGGFAGWVVSSATLLLLPKCPVCLAGYVTLFSGVGISMAGASNLRTALLNLAVAGLLGLAVKRILRLRSPDGAGESFTPR